MHKSFKEFLIYKIGVNNDYRMLDTIMEMAETKSIERVPVNIDKEDIEFLSQFPHNLWPKAQQQRMHMLFIELKRLHEVKIETGLPELEKAILDYLVDRSDENKNKLKNLDSQLRLNNQEIEIIDNANSVENINNNTKETNIGIAEREAELHLNKIFKHINDPKSVTFTFKDIVYNLETGKKPANKTSKTITINANPFLNRLYHKLQHNAGENHIEGSGLEGEVAKYGYYLFHPIEGDGKNSHVTAGFKFPTDENISERIRSFLVLNGHRMFGELPEGAKWMKTAYKDTETRANAIRKYLPKAEEILKRDKDRWSKLNTTSKRISAIENKAIEMLVGDIESGKIQLHGPPNPIFPEGIPVKIITRKIRKSNKRAYVRKDIDNPPLYLPFKKEKGNWVPIVNPAHFYRELNAQDYETYTEEMPDGRKVEKTRLRVPEEDIRGWDKKWVKSNVERPYGKKIQFDGAFDYNHNTTTRENYVSGTRDYEEKFNRVFGPQRKIQHYFMNGILQTGESEGGMYEDIFLGIMQCIRSDSCGKKTKHEQNLMLQSINLLYQGVYLEMISSLRTKTFNLTKGSQRRLFSKNKTSLFAQKSWGGGGGTARTRSLTQSARTEKLTKGEKQYRRFETSGLAFPYNITTLNKFMADMNNLRNQASQADQQSQQVLQIAKSAQEATENLRNLIEKGIDDKIEIGLRLTSMLAAFNAHYGNTDIDSQQWAEDTVKSWVEQGKNAEAMVAAFFNLDDVKAAQREIPDAKPIRAGDKALSEMPNLEMQKAQEIALAELNSDLASVGNDINNLRIRGKFFTQTNDELSPYVSGSLDRIIKSQHQWLSTADGADDLRKVLVAAQTQINKKLTPTTAAQTPDEKPPKLAMSPNDNYRILLRGSHTPENMMRVAHVDDFHDYASLGMLKHVKTEIERNQDSYSPEDYHSAIDKLNKTIKDRS